MTEAVDLPTLPALIVGHVSHARLKPVRHVFRHRSYQWLVDVDEMNRFPFWMRPLVSFKSSDHLNGGTSDQGIRGDIADFLQDHEITLGPSDRIIMLANARVFGHVFDPLSVFWILRADRTIKAVVFEVHNTYGGRHAYFIDINANNSASVDKAFYVSPFNDLRGRYKVRLRLDSSTVKVVVGLDRDGSRILTAVSEGVPEVANRTAVLHRSLSHFLMTQRVSVLIRYHGIRLWLRKLPIVPRPHNAKGAKL